MIAILISTYNGEKYIREQLNSLLNQTFDDYLIYVRDDGSIDATISIIEEYEQKYNNIVLVKDSMKRKGACKSFMWLLEKVEADYYMFCDQDDVWFPNKIQLSFDAIKSEEFRSINKPILVHSDLVVVDNKLRIIANSLWENDNINPYRITTKYLPILNYITGCTMLFNKHTKKIVLSESKNIMMHDYWIGLCVNANAGVIISLPVPTMYYRQHENNVIGSRKEYKPSKIQRYLHFPDFEYSKKLYNMIKDVYKISLFEYIVLKLNFYFKK